MTAISATQARSNLYRLVDEVNDTHQPIIISGRKGQAVLVGEDDWRAIQETIHLLSIPGMRESIREGLDIPCEQCEEDLGW
jgi:prevent-host-death family protein